MIRDRQDWSVIPADNGQYCRVGDKVENSSCVHLRTVLLLEILSCCASGETGFLCQFFCCAGKQRAVCHSSTEAETTSLDAVL